MNTAPRRVDRARNALAAVGPTVSGLVVGTWFLLLWRELPYPLADQGMFVSVAERLLAGDRLYVDVFENKDPLFHYTNALARIVGPWGSWVLSVALVAIAAGAVWAIMRSLRTGARPAALVSFVATPVIITGTYYFPGTSHLPGVVLVLCVVAGALRQNVVVVGVCVGLLAGFKLVMFPMGVLVVLVMALMQRRWSFAVKAGVVAACVVVVCLVVVYARGELGPYVDTLGENVDYSQAAAGQGAEWSVVGHLRRVFNLNNLVMAVTTAVLAVWALATQVRDGRPRTSEIRLLAVITLVLMAYAVVALSVTGLWGHHGMILVPMAVLAAVLLVVNGGRAIRSAAGTGMLAILAFTWLLAGAPFPVKYTEPVEFARMNLNLLTAESGEAALIRSTGEPTTYARVGGVDDPGHAFGLRDWTLACPRISLTSIDPVTTLDDALACLPSANVILVATDVGDDPRYPAWNEFLRGVDALLAAEYSCTDADSGRICERLDANG